MSSSVSRSRCCVKARGRIHEGEREGEVRTSLSSLASVVASWVVLCHDSWVTSSCDRRLVNEGEGEGVAVVA